MQLTSILLAIFVFLTILEVKVFGAPAKKREAKSISLDPKELRAAFAAEERKMVKEQQATDSETEREKRNFLNAMMKSKEFATLRKRIEKALDNALQKRNHAEKK